MSFKGDLSTIGLAEVFQMISMSQKEGTLIVQDQDSRKCIFFGTSGVKLLSTGKRKGLRVGDLLVRAGKITEEGLNEALENAKIQKKLVGEVLVESGLVPEEVMAEIVRTQIEEEIYDLFLWKRANFEFVEGSPADELVDPDSRVTKLSFDVNGLLLEAVRRADEWAVINKVIPSSDSIFVFASEADIHDEDQTASEGLKRIYRLLDGQTSVHEIVDNTGVSEFEVSKALIDLANRGRTRLLSVNEMMELASKRMTQGSKDLAIRTYQAAALQSPDDPKVAVGIARILETEGLNREAAGHYLKAGRLYMAQGDLDHALDSMQRAGERDPDDLEVKTGIFEVYAAAGNLDEGKKLARELVNQAMMMADNNRARALCDRLLVADPTDLDFRISRARILHRMNLKSELEKDLDFIKKNLPVEPKENERIQRALHEVLGRPITTPGPKKAGSKVARAVSGRRGGVGKWVALLVIALLLGGAGYAVKFEMDARKELARVDGEARALAAQDKHEEAQSRVGGFLKSAFALSPWQKEKAQLLLRELGEGRQAYDVKRQAELEAERARNAETLRTLSEQMAVDERQSQPLVALQSAKALLDLATRVSHTEYRQKAEQAIARIDAHLKAAQKSREMIEAAEKEGRFRDAALGVEDLLSRFPNTPAANGILYPLSITSRPAGVKVTNLRSNTVIGETPVVYRMRQGEGVRLRFEKDGYEKTEENIADKLVGVKHVNLTVKRESWVKPGIPSANEPCAGDEMVVLATGDRLVALRAADGRLLWRTEALDGRIQGAPRRSPAGWIFAGTTTGWIYAVEPKQDAGRIAWKARVPEGRLTASPGFSADGEFVFAPAGSRMLRVFKARTGEAGPARELPGDMNVEPVAAGDVVVVACDEGSVLGLKGPGAPAWRIQTERNPGPMSVAEGVVYFAAGERVFAVKADGGQVAWRTVLPAGGPAGRVAPVGGAVFAVGRDGRLHAIAAGGGQLQSSHDLGAGAVEGGVVAAGKVLLFGSDDQTIYAVDADARETPLWRFKANGKVRAAGAVNGGRVFFGAEDILYALELN